MRIISQDKKSDIPYDSVTVYVSSLLPKDIQVDLLAYKSTEVIGIYNSEEDSLYVMKSMRKAFRDGCDYFFMPSADYVTFWRKTEAEGGEV